jgi:TolB protein
MKTIPLIILLIASAAFGADAQQKIAFARDDDTVWVANLDGGGAKKIAAGGVYPEISPDGTKLAFNTDSASTSARRIAVIDLATGARTTFKDVPSDNAYGPVWSPNSAKVIFYIYINNIWDIGICNADGSGFRVLKSGGPNDQMFNSAGWMPDGQSLFCQDLTNLYQIGLDGIVMKQWPLATVFPNGDADSGVRFDVSPNGQMLLADINVDEDPGRSGWEGPPPTTWLMNLSTDKAAKLTPNFWWEPCWVTNDTFLCIGQGAKEKAPSIYLRSLDGKTVKRLVKDATDPSVSR